MFRRNVSAVLLLAMTVLGTGTLAGAAQAAPAPPAAAGSRHLPAAPVPAQESAPAAPMSHGEMSSATGAGGFAPGGCLTRFWKKYVKKVVKVVWEVIKTIIDIVFNSTTESHPGIVGEVVEHYEGEEQTEEIYNSHSDYENGNLASSSYVDYGYTHMYTDYSNGSYEY